LKVCTQSYGPPKSWESKFWEFWDSHLGVPGQNDIWVLVPWPGTKNIGGRWWLPSSPDRGESCEFVFAYGSFVHQKCSSYALTNLLFGLCRFVWVIDLLVTLLRPYLGAPACSSTLEVLRVKEHAPTLYPSVVFTFRLIVEYTKEFGGALINNISHLAIIKKYNIFWVNFVTSSWLFLVKLVVTIICLKWDLNLHLLIKIQGL
jgi:hypothetical protein